MLPTSLDFTCVLYRRAWYSPRRWKLQARRSRTRASCSLVAVSSSLAKSLENERRNIEQRIVIAVHKLGGTSIARGVADFCFVAVNSADSRGWQWACGLAVSRSDVFSPIIIRVLTQGFDTLLFFVNEYFSWAQTKRSIFFVGSGWRARRHAGLLYSVFSTPNKRGAIHSKLLTNPPLKLVFWENPTSTSYRINFTLPTKRVWAILSGRKFNRKQCIITWMQTKFTLQEVKFFVLPFPYNSWRILVKRMPSEW